MGLEPIDCDGRSIIDRIRAGCFFPSYCIILSSALGQCSVVERNWLQSSTIYRVWHGVAKKSEKPSFFKIPFTLHKSEIITTKAAPEHHTATTILDRWHQLSLSLYLTSVLKPNTVFFCPSFIFIDQPVIRLFLPRRPAFWSYLFTFDMEIDGTAPAQSSMIA